MSCKLCELRTDLPCTLSGGEMSHEGHPFGNHTGMTLSYLGIKEVDGIWMHIFLFPTPQTCVTCGLVTTYYAEYCQEGYILDLTEVKVNAERNS